MIFKNLESKFNSNKEWKVMSKDDTFIDIKFTKTIKGSRNHKMYNGKNNKNQTFFYIICDVSTFIWVISRAISGNTYYTVIPIILFVVAM